MNVVPLHCFSRIFIFKICLSPIFCLDFYKSLSIYYDSYYLIYLVEVHPKSPFFFKKLIMYNDCINKI